MSRISHHTAAPMLEPCAGHQGGEFLTASLGPCANVLGIAVEALNLEGALARVAQILRSGRRGYVCAVGVHGILEARRNPDVAQAYAEAALAIPDGTPTVWVGRLQKHASMDHVTGPSLMQEVFSREEFAGYRATCKIIENRRRFRRTRALSCRRCSAAPFGRHLDTAEMRISIFGHAATVAVWS